MPAPAARRIAAPLMLVSRYGIDVLGGLHEFARQQQLDWIILPMEALRPLEPRLLKELRIDAAVIQLFHRESLDAIRRLGLPAVNVSNAVRTEGLPTVVCDDYAVGEMAAEFLAGRGFAHFAFCGKSHNPTSELRLAGFGGALRRLPTAPHVWHADLTLARFYDSPAEFGPFADWLGALPKPVALFCFSDDDACLAAALCRLRGLRVPEEISILGVNNDALGQATSHVALSSVALNGVQVGMHAGHRIAEMLAGRHRGGAPVVAVPPLRIVEGRSTDFIAVEDPQLALAVRIIRRRCDESLPVDRVAREVGLSRRVLELRFRRHLGISPHEETTRARIARAKNLLVTTTLKLDDVGRLSGFGDGHRLSVVFKRRVGVNPSAFRSGALPGGAVAGQRS